MSEALQVTVNGLAVGLQYALLLFGLLLIYQSSRVLNFAHGQVGMVGAVVAFLAVTSYSIPVWVAAVIAVIVAAGLSAAIDVLFIRRLSGSAQSEGIDLIVTLGLFLCFGSLGTILLAGGRTRRFPQIFDGGVHILGAYLDATVIASVLVSTLLFVAIYTLLVKTRLGAVLRAIASDPGMAGISGWTVPRLRSAAWILGGATVGIAALLTASRNAVGPEFLVDPLIKAVFAGVLAGFDRFVAPIMVAVGLGIYENWVGAVAGSQFRVPAVFLGAVIILAFLPKRWLATPDEARA